MSDEMKWTCPACGMYVGAGHSCYTPSERPAPPTNTYEMGRREGVRETLKRVAQLPSPWRPAHFRKDAYICEMVCDWCECRAEWQTAAAYGDAAPESEHPTHPPTDCLWPLAQAAIAGEQTP